MVIRCMELQVAPSAVCFNTTHLKWSAWWPTQSRIILQCFLQWWSFPGLLQSVAQTGPSATFALGLCSQQWGPLWAWARLASLLPRPGASTGTSPLKSSLATEACSSDSWKWCILSCCFEVLFVGFSRSLIISQLSSRNLKIQRRRDFSRALCKSPLYFLGWALYSPVAVGSQVPLHQGPSVNSQADFTRWHC